MSTKLVLRYEVYGGGEKLGELVMSSEGTGAIRQVDVEMVDSEGKLHHTYTEKEFTDSFVQICELMTMVRMDLCQLDANKEKNV